MTNDFSTQKKVLRRLQKLQATSKLYTFDITFHNFPDECVSVYLNKSGDDTEIFSFYDFDSPEDRERTFNKMLAWTK